MTLKKTPLHKSHQKLKARLVDFAGWEMPIQYSGTLPEHLAVRKNAGLFDISHMGEIEVKGSNATTVVQHMTCNNITTLTEGQAQYSALLTHQGTFVDDVIVYKFSKSKYLLCVNASNSDKVFEWIQVNAPKKAEIINRSKDFVQLAIQGPSSQEILQKITPTNLSDLSSYHFRVGKITGHQAIISRTGYTGEKGYELYLSPESGATIWESILRIGLEHGLQPIGLAARNTLRLEMKYPLYGNDIDNTTTPFEAGLDWIVKLDQGEFIGRDALLQQKSEGIKRQLVGFELLERGIPRDGYLVYLGDMEISKVTSGSYSPSLGKGIGLTYLPSEHAKIGTEIKIMIRKVAKTARIIATPFYKGLI